jgi:hypothetical protein
MRYIKSERMNSKALLILLILVSLALKIPAQSSKRAFVKGKTSDSLSSAPLSFSGIRIFKSEDKKLENESVATEAGDFSVELKYGRYYAQIDFMGYKPYKTS